MIDGIFEKKPRRHIQDLNIVPILDMLTTVIFFLLLSTSFMEYTKHTVPPSATATVTTTSSELPLAPKLLYFGQKGFSKLLLRWGGKQPGEDSFVIRKDTSTLEGRNELVSLSAKMVQKFSKEHPDEKTVQLGLAGKLPYQDLISVMDAVRPSMPDVVLISYAEAEAVGQGVGMEAK